MPSRAQMRALADQGKAVEVVVGGEFMRSDPRRLLEILDLMEDFVGASLFSQGASTIGEIKNPLDILNYLDAMTGRRRPWVDPLLKNPLDYLVDTMYRRGGLPLAQFFYLAKIMPPWIAGGMSRGEPPRLWSIAATL